MCNVHSDLMFATLILGTRRVRHFTYYYSKNKLDINDYVGLY